LEDLALLRQGFGAAWGYSQWVVGTQAVRSTAAHRFHRQLHRPRRWSVQGHSRLLQSRPECQLSLKVSVPPFCSMGLAVANCCCCLPLRRPAA